MKFDSIGKNFSFSGEQIYLLALAVVVGLFGGWGGGRVPLPDRAFSRN